MRWSGLQDGRKSCTRMKTSQSLSCEFGTVHRNELVASTASAGFGRRSARFSTKRKHGARLHAVPTLSVVLCGCSSELGVPPFHRRCGRQGNRCLVESRTDSRPRQPGPWRCSPNRMTVKVGFFSCPGRLERKYKPGEVFWGAKGTFGGKQEASGANFFACSEG